MPRFGTTLRNVYSGAQIGNYLLPQLNSLVNDPMWASIFGGGTKKPPTTSSAVSAAGPVRLGGGAGTVTDPAPSGIHPFFLDKAASTIFKTETTSYPQVNGGRGNTTPAAPAAAPKVAAPTSSIDVATPAANVIGAIANGGSGSTIGSGVGAAVGSFAGPIGTVVGGILGGLLGGNEESPEEIARRRIDAYTGRLAGIRDSETRRVSEEMSRGTSSAMRQAANIAGRQAGALGKTEQTASFALPATTNIAVAGGKQLRGAVSNIQSSYNRAIADAEAGMFGVPATESTSDVLANLGETFAARGAQEDYFTRLERILSERDRMLGHIRGNG